MNRNRNTVTSVTSSYSQTRSTVRSFSDDAFFPALSTQLLEASIWPHLGGLIFGSEGPSGGP